MANTTFLVSEPGVHGETYYKPTISELEVIYTSGEIVTLPDDYQDPYTLRTPTIHPVHTLHTPNLINNSSNNLSEKEEKTESMRDVDQGKEGNSSNLRRSPKIGCTTNKSSPDSDGQGVKMGVLGCKSENGAKEPLNESGIGLNPRKFALPLKVIFLKHCDRFVGEDLKKPGEVTNYGPYEQGNVAKLPKLHATTLIMKGVALEA